MEMLECTAGAVGGSTMRVAAVARPAAPALGIHLLLPNVRTHSQGGVGLHEVRGRGLGWGGQLTGSKDTVKSIDRTSFPTRLGPPPDSPPVN